ncbi:MAG: RNA polymerase factor sigma-54 [Planctomycetes bacterium]|nr:RNA polymerase factor sigma-54 [Planctomycetota bacterium]
MSLDIRLGQRQEQRLALLPQMLQSIEVLQLATSDLLQFLELEAERNETLELRAAPLGEQEVEPGAARERDDDGESWRPRFDADDGSMQGFLESIAAHADSLVDFVRQQLAFREVGGELGEAVIRLSENLDERGLLPFDLEELAGEFDLPLELLQEAHAELQSLEPRGIGAADAIEAMLLQAEGDPDLGLIERLLRDHLDALGRNRLPEVARDLDLSLDELQDVLERIRRLNPRPASEFSDEAAAPIRPDAFAVYRDGRVHVALDESALPSLGIDAEYAAMAIDRDAEKQVRDYLRPKLRLARDLISALEQRQETLLRVVRAVMQQQVQFLQRGRSAIVPLRMSEIADELELATSTISRAIAGKHVATEYGLFRLRDFFDGGRLKATTVAGQGRMGVAQQIADLVAAEDKQAPLSDDDLVTALQQRGVHVARRTIAKYRKELGLPSSYRRRQFGEKR